MRSKHSRWQGWRHRIPENPDAVDADPIVAIRHNAHLSKRRIQGSVKRCRSREPACGKRLPGLIASSAKDLPTFDILRLSAEVVPVDRDAAHLICTLELNYIVDVCGPGISQAVRVAVDQ